MARGLGRPVRGAAMAWRLAAATALVVVLCLGALRPADAAGTILYEQWASPGGGIEGGFFADDFVVPAGGWLLGGVDVLFTGMVPSFTVAIHQNGAGDLPGALVASYAGLVDPAPVTESPAHVAHALVLPTPLALPAGTYWLAVTPASASGWRAQLATAGQAGATRCLACSDWTRLGVNLTFRLRMAETMPTTTTARGAATYGDATARLTAVVAAGGQPVSVGGRVIFSFGGQTYQGTTDAQGVARVTVPLPPGTAAGTYPNRVQASYEGAAGYEPSSGSGPLVVARKVITVKPTDRTVGLKQPNPPTTPPAGCVQQQTATSACWLELTNSSTFVNEDDWSDLNLTQLRFQYSRNPASTNATEKLGSTYRITALGVSSVNYDLRYQPGTLTVSAAP